MGCKRLNLETAEMWFGIDREELFTILRFKDVRFWQKFQGRKFIVINPEKLPRTILLTTNLLSLRNLLIIVRRVFRDPARSAKWFHYRDTSLKASHNCDYPLKLLFWKSFLGAEIIRGHLRLCLKKGGDSYNPLIPRRKKEEV